MWSWAKNFVLFDNFHQTIVGPSTPNAIAIISGQSGQSGQTQWALHPNEAPTVTHANPGFPNVKGASYASTVAGNSNAFVPIVADPGPFPGSLKDPSAVKPPYNFDENAANPALNLTFATQPLSFMGSSIGQTIQHDQNSRADLIDVPHDIFTIATKNKVVNSTASTARSSNSSTNCSTWCRWRNRPTRRMRVSSARAIWAKPTLARPMTRPTISAT